MAAGETMKTMVLSSLALSLVCMGPAVAQEPAALGALDGMVGRPTLTDAPPQEQEPSAPPAPPTLPVAVRAKAPRQAARGTPLAAASLDSLKATRERPLFSETRSPPVVAVAEPVVAAPPPEPKPEEPAEPELTLVGTAVSSEGPVAVFLNSSAREVVKLRVGEADSGWTLRSVEPKSTILEKDSREVTLSLPAPDTAGGPGIDQTDVMDAYLQQQSTGEFPTERRAPRARPAPFPKGLPGRGGPRPKPGQIGEEF
jgi:general secretion pathway protein N